MAGRPAPDGDMSRESAAWEAAYTRTRRSLGLRRRRIQFFDWSGRWPVLDLAAGDGLDMGLIRELVSGPVVGVDISPNLLRRASGRRVVGDAHKLAFADGSFSVVVANSVLHHLDPPVAFAEIARVLRPGGRLMMMEPRPCAARRLLDWLTLSFAPGQWFGFFRARRVSLQEEMDVYSHWLAVYHLLAGWMDELGFKREKYRLTPCGALSQWRAV